MVRHLVPVVCLLLHWSVCQAAVFNPSGGPVYVNAEQQLLPATSAVSETLLTQTVYGFLDFTTVIGNTVMIFSPQSAPAAGVSPTTKPAPTSTTVIETKPPTTNHPPIEIKPSKTEAPPKTSEKKATLEKEKNVVKKSSVEVKVNAPSNVVFSSVVEVRGGPPQEKTPQISSKVEVREGSTSRKDIVSTKVEVKVASSVVEVKSSEVKSPTSVVEEANGKKELPKPIVNVKVGTSSQEGVPKPEAILSSKVEVISSSDEPAISGNNVDSPAEYDFLSRQPSEIVDETYRVIDLRPTIKHHHKNNKPRLSPSKISPPDVHPTGLVTSMGGTVVKDGLTTVHETSVLGTYISGKYAQVLQSTSHIYQSQKKPKPTPVQSKILKTVAPSLKAPRPSLEPTPVSTLQEDSALPLEALFNSPSGGNLIRTSRRPAVGGLPFKNRFNRNKGGYREETKEQELEPEPEEVTPAPGYKKNRNRGSQTQRSSYKNNRFGRPSQTAELATVSVYSEPVTSPSNRKYQSSQSRRSGFRPSKGDNAVDSNSSRDRDSRRSFKPKPSPAQADQASTSLYKFKLARPTGRWQYKTTPKPRVTIRRSDEGVESTTQSMEKEVRPDGDQEQQGSDISDSRDLENLVSATESTLPLETIKVEISTPVEFKNTYYEIATIKSPYTFQVGSVKNTRYITVTSTFEKNLVEPTEAPAISPSEPLTENILASTQHIYDNKEPPLDSSIATLPPIGLSGDAETPPLETMTETFSTTQLLLKTHILPVVYGGMNTSSYTLVQSYHITRIVTATKTLPPMEVYQFVPSKTLNEFNTRLDEAGSELHLELEFGDNNDQDDDEHPNAARAFPPDLDLANVGSEFDLSDVDKSKFPDHLRLKKAHHSGTTPQPLLTEPTTPSLSPEQLQQLALLRFLNPNANIPQVITQSRPVVKMETLYESHVIPFFNGQSTIFSTLSRPIATVSKTEYEYVTSTLAMQQPQQPQFNPLLQQQPQLNPLLPQQPQFAVTSTPVVTQTLVTQTDSKVLKLTFGAKTAYTTLFSTRVVPTQLTTYLTASVPVQPTAFPGYFPAPYNPFFG